MRILIVPLLFFGCAAHNAAKIPAVADPLVPVFDPITNQWAVQTPLASSTDPGFLPADSARVAVIAGGVNIKFWGAKGDTQVQGSYSFGGDVVITSGTDDTVAIQAALDAAKTGRFKLYVPPGIYKITAPLSWDDAFGVEMSGASSSFQGRSVFIYTAAGAGSLLTLNSSSDIKITNISFRHNNTGYTGRLVATGQSQALSDANQITFEDCYFAGGPSARQAHALLALNFALFVTVRKCNFSSSVHGIIGVDGGYSNVVKITDSVFGGHSANGIGNPGEAWAISNCAFESDYDGFADGIGVVDNVQAYAFGLSIDACWFGDSHTDTGTKSWITLFALGVSITGARMTEVGPMPGIRLLPGCQGVAVIGGRIEAQPAIAGPAGNSGTAYGLSVIGCDMPNGMSKANIASIFMGGNVGGSAFASAGLQIGGTTATMDDPSNTSLFLSPIDHLPASTSAAVLGEGVGIADANGDTVSGVVLSSPNIIDGYEVGIVGGRNESNGLGYIAGRFGALRTDIGGIRTIAYAKVPVAIPTYSNGTRPPAAAVVAGSEIFNSDTKKINISDGVNWYDAIGNLAP